MNNYKPELFGRYILLEKLAMGGMAEVFLTKSLGAQGIGKFLAMKRILPQYSSNDDFINMFTEEAKICMNLSHSNIAKIYEFGMELGQFYLVMELIDGKNLRQILSRIGKESRKGFTVDQSVYIAKEVAAGMDHAHRCLDGSSGKPLNIIHRDMSPQNVMISFEGEIKVVDFGIAKAESGKEETRAGTVKGKFSYMSPEQASGEKIDSRTDVYSLGIVLWEMLANKRLFTSSSDMNTLNKIREGKIPSISKINPQVPEELERIVNIALSKDINNRYQTCAEFYKDLNRFLNRFYPDFSSHDFSIFIKSLYANEVLANRKKYVDYSKISQEFVKEQKSDFTGNNEQTNPTYTHSFLEPSSSTEVSFDFKKLHASTSASIRTGTQATRSVSNSRIISKKRNDIFSPANMVIGALTLVAFALIVSALIPTSNNPTTAIEQASQESINKSLDKHYITIESSPNGAEIYLDGKNTGFLTPGRITVPAYDSFQIGLRKDGYINYNRTITSPGNGGKKEFTLSKQSIGYLNIRTKFNKTTVIYINNTPLKERAPITGYPVPASRSITIKAVDTFRKKYQTKVVTVKRDEKLNIYLVPNRSYRNKR